MRNMKSGYIQYNNSSQTRKRSLTHEQLWGNPASLGYTVTPNADTFLSFTWYFLGPKVQLCGKFIETKNSWKPQKGP